MLSRVRPSHFLTTAIPTAPSRLRSQSPFLLEFTPPLHRDLRAVEFALVFDARFLSLLPSCLSSIAPGEVVEFPEGVDREDEVPDWEREQVDEHPYNVRPAMGCQYDEHRWETKNQGEEYEGNDLWRGANDGDYYWKVS
jgi:hypothetical protein